MSRNQLLKQLAKSEGYRNVYHMLEANIIESVVPGICQCGYSCETEPDSQGGWCEECDKPSVKSCFVLAQII